MVAPAIVHRRPWIYARLESETNGEHAWVELTCAPGGAFVDGARRGAPGHDPAFVMEGVILDPLPTAVVLVRADDGRWTAGSTTLDLES